MRTFLVSMFLVSLLFMGIFIGINFADKGLNQVQGQDSAPQGFHVSTDDEGEFVSLSLLGKTFTNEEYRALTEGSDEQAGQEEENQPQAEETAAVPVLGSTIKQEEPVNMYAELGAALGKITQDIVRGIMEQLIAWMDGII